MQEMQCRPPSCIRVPGSPAVVLPESRHGLGVPSYISTHLKAKYLTNFQARANLQALAEKGNLETLRDQ